MSLDSWSQGNRTSPRRRAIAPQVQLARSSEHPLESRIISPGISKAPRPPIQMARSSEPPIERAARSVALVVPADVVAEEVMSEEDVSGASADLRRFGQFDVRIAGRLCECLWASPCEEGGMSLMRAGPDPEIPAVVSHLIVEEQAREKRERARDGLAGLVAVDVGLPGRWSKGGMFSATCA